MLRIVRPFNQAVVAVAVAVGACACACPSVAVVAVDTNSLMLRCVAHFLVSF